MKKLVTLAVAGTFALGLTACGSDNGPEKAVEDFVAAAKDKDYAALCDAFDPEIIKTLEDADPGKDCATIFKENEKDLNIPDDPKVEILGSEIAHDFKPKPRVYHAACEAFDLPPGECMMVAAHSADLAAAADCGLMTGFVARPDERGPGKGESEASVPVDLSGRNLIDLAAKLFG